jgi:Dolichyl-phosphate-mannose-protein mannosyltransferase
MDAAPVDSPSARTRLPGGDWPARLRTRVRGGRGAAASGGEEAARATARTAERNLHRIALGGLLLATFGLRLWGIKQGLPYSYNSDEARHYVPRAIAYFSHDYNPNYFLNPPAYGYLLNIVFELWFGSADAVSRVYAADPTRVFVVARVVVAVLGTLSVWLTYLAGVRMFNRTVGLAAGAIFGLAFLPIFYSHLALNDTPTLAPVALSLYGTAGVLRNGAKRDYVIAGIGCGIAAATKYTGAIAFVCLLAACLCDGLSGRTLVQSLLRLALCGVVAGLAFVIANPYSVLDFSTFHQGVTTQQALAAGSDPEKLGTTSRSGTAFYLWTYTWGLGWVPSLAAVGGAVALLVRRRVAAALVLIPAPIVFMLYMGDQQRFFGRWLMPTFPIVALLGAYGVVSLGRWLINDRHVPAVAVIAATAIVLLAQSVTTVLHSDRVLSRPDTRNLTRAWMVKHVPAGSKIVVEPVVSDNWGYDVGRASPATPSGARWKLWDTSITDVDVHDHDRHLPKGQHVFVGLDQYERSLRPELLSEYAKADYCWVVIGSLQAGRSFAQPGIAPNAIAYYAQLANDAKLMYHVSPFSTDRRAVPFSFDWSIDYYPSQYVRPGPEMSVYRLHIGKCAAASSSG